MDVKRQLPLTRDMDRISELPEVVVLSILSFLEIREVVTTSILSSKWRYVWKCIPCLDFSSVFMNNDKEHERNMNAVDKVLFSHDAMSNITKFTLKCEYWLWKSSRHHLYEGSRVNSWISNVIMHKLQEFELVIQMRGSFIINPALFLTKSLTVLKLGFHGIVHLMFPISFPSIKILHLVGLDFADGNLTENFSSCPNLEELRIFCCKWINGLSKVSISNPSLKLLEIASPLIDNNVNYLEINAPSLVSFYLSRAHFPLQCSISVMSSLASAMVLIHGYHAEEQTHFIATNLLGALSHMVSFTKDLLYHFPEFELRNLLDLELDQESNYVSPQSLGLFLQTTPHLESISFNTGVSRDEFIQLSDNFSEGQEVASHGLIHLRKVEYQYYVGYPVELQLVQFLLDNARHLNEIIIHLDPEIATEDEKSLVIESFMRMHGYRNIFDIRYHL